MSNHLAQTNFQQEEEFENDSLLNFGHLFAPGCGFPKVHFPIFTGFTGT